ncbi:MAG: SDR family oxidoreductase [Acetobacteraceae bacterium]|nr:SDR family oxidoreductase [Acetobacteraceae bacterium]
MHTDLTGRVAIVTGGAGGIGAATAEVLRECGARVALFDRADDRTREVSARMPDALPLVVDVTDAAAVVKACRNVEDHFGRIDILVNVAGGGTPRTMAGMSPADWDRVVALNLNAPFYCMQAVAPAMRRAGGGAIVTVSSLAGIQISLNSGASYTAAKSGLLGLTRHAAFELSVDNIRVNAVLPGPIMTPQMDAKIEPEMRDAMARKVPIGRWLTPREVATSILFFCSDLSSGCTGTHVVVDGGLHIASPVEPAVYFARRDRTAAA